APTAPQAPSMGVARRGKLPFPLRNEKTTTAPAGRPGPYIGLLFRWRRCVRLRKACLHERGGSSRAGTWPVRVGSTRRRTLLVGPASYPCRPAERPWCDGTDAVSAGWALLP